MGGTYCYDPSNPRHCQSFTSSEGDSPCPSGQTKCGNEAGTSLLLTAGVPACILSGFGAVAAWFGWTKSGDSTDQAQEDTKTKALLSPEDEQNGACAVM